MEEDRTRQEQEQKKMAGRPETQQNSPHSRRLPMPGGKDPDRGEEEQEPVVDTGFMQEKIKARPVNHRKILRRTLGTAGLAVLFGGVACLVFLVMEPVISRLLYPDEHKVQEVTFSEDGQTADSAAGSSLPCRRRSSPQASRRRRAKMRPIRPPPRKRSMHPARISIRRSGR